MRSSVWCGASKTKSPDWRRRNGETPRAEPVSRARASMIRHERVSPPLAFGRIVAAGTTLIVIYLALRAVAGVPQSLLLAFFGVLLAIVLDVPTTALARRMPRSLAL